MNKKIVKIGLGVLASIFVLLLIIPLLFQGKITKIAKEQVNANVNAVIDFEELSVSLLRSFPDVSVDLRNLTVINKAPFVGDTLAAVGHTYVDISLMSLLGDVPKVNKITLTDVFANVKVNKKGVANYNITLPTEKEEETSETTASSSVSLNIEAYALENVNVTYEDTSSDMRLEVVNFNHSGSGDLSKDVLELDTHTNAKAITFIMDEVAYLKELQLKYDAKVGVDYAKDLKLTFKDNVAHINDLHLAFDGVFEMLKTSYLLDFKLKSEQSEFKSLLSLIPNAYTADFPKVTTTGALDLHGIVKGAYSENTIPTLDIVVKTKNASVQYPALPNAIENISIDAHITNTTGLMDDVKVEVKNFGFKIAQDVFKANATVTNPISNLTVTSNINGQVNLGNLKNAYPMPPLDFELKGLVKANVAVGFDMNSIEKEKYHKIDTKGTVTVAGVEVVSEFTPKPLMIQKSKMLFSVNHIDLKETAVSSGASDIQLTGGLDDIYKYAFSDGVLKGKLAVTSNLFKVSDFYEADTTTVVNNEVQDSITPQQFKIPEQIELRTSVAAKEVVYDKIVLNNFKGNALVKDQRITFSNATANLFKGAISLTGYVDTKPQPTAYDFDMKLKQVDIASAFYAMDMLKKIAPIVGAFRGRFDTDLDIKGALGNDYMPILSQLAGGAFAQLQVDKIDVSNNKFLSLAENRLDFLDFSKADLKDLKTKVSFDGGKVNVQPFTMKYKGIPLTIGGSHSFDNQMNYNLSFDLPAKYLGSQASSLVSKLSPEEQKNVSVPLEVKVGGTITKPTVAPNMKNAVTALTNKLINNQKEKVKEDVKKKLNQFLGGKSQSETDSTGTKEKSSKDKVKEAGKKLLKSLF